jgi:hypothetical protein
VKVGLIQYFPQEMESTMFRKIIFPLVLTLVIALTACNMNEATVSPETFYTQAAETAAVAEALTAMAVTATPSTTPTLEATNTLELSLTPTNGTTTRGPWSSSTPRPGSGTACDNAQFMNVQDPPDFSTIAPETEFKVTWRFKNLGPCTWTTNYKIVFTYVSDTGKGGIFDAPSPEYFPKKVLPGEEVDISITLQAPTKKDGYQVFFQLQNNKGYYFLPEFWIIFSVE